MKIPFLNFKVQHEHIRQEMLQAFQDVYDSNWYVMGNHLLQFEKDYAAFSGMDFAVGLSNGLDALYLSLKALDIKEGDEVIVPSNTYIATALAVSYTGATPVFVEPDVLTYNLCPNNLRKAIGPKTKAVIPVHLYGQACNMTEIMKVAREHKLFVVEDNAQAHGATFNGKITGSFGHINAVSFYPGKNLGALGDAGGVTTDDAELAEKVRMLRNYGSRVKYNNDVIGHNMRLDELQAAFLSVKLKHLEAFTEQRREIALLYDERLKGLGDLVLPHVDPQAEHVYHLYVVRTGNRDELQQHLTAKGIGTLIHYPIPPHLQLAYSGLGYKKGDFPVAEKLADTSLSIPLWPGMTGEQAGEVCDAIESYFVEIKLEKHQLA